MLRKMLGMTALVLAGCATLTETQCRGGPADWEWLGEYDAVQGDQPWIEAYAKACAPYGVTVDEEHYLMGWEVGHAEFNRRLGYMN